MKANPELKPTVVENWELRTDSWELFWEIVL